MVIILSSIKSKPPSSSSGRQAGSSRVGGAILSASVLPGCLARHVRDSIRAAGKSSEEESLPLCSLYLNFSHFSTRSLLFPSQSAHWPSRESAAAGLGASGVQIPKRDKS